MGRDTRRASLATAMGMLLATGLMGGSTALVAERNVAAWTGSGTALAGTEPGGGRSGHGQSVEIKGPVTQINPLRVLGQPIQVVHDTLWVGIASGDLLRVGDEVEINALYDAGVLRAARIERKAKSPSEWKLVGYVTHRHMGGIDVGAQLVALDANTRVRDCGGSIPRIGQWVEVTAVPRPGFHPGDPVKASKLECRSR